MFKAFHSFTASGDDPQESAASAGSALKFRRHDRGYQVPAPDPGQRHLHSQPQQREEGDLLYWQGVLRPHQGAGKDGP